MPADFSVERDATRSNLATVVHTIADGIESGALAIEGDDARVELAVPTDVGYELEVETDEDEEIGGENYAVELELEVSWPAGPAHEVTAPSVGPRSEG